MSSLGLLMAAGAGLCGTPMASRPSAGRGRLGLAAWGASSVAVASGAAFATSWRYICSTASAGSAGSVVGAGSCAAGAGACSASSRLGPRSIVRSPSPTGSPSTTGAGSSNLSAAWAKMLRNEGTAPVDAAFLASGLRLESSEGMFFSLPALPWPVW